MLPEKTLLKKILLRDLKSGRLKVSMPKMFVTPKERENITPEESEKAFMDILASVIKERLRMSGNRTGKKRKRLVKRIKAMEAFIYRD